MFTKYAVKMTPAFIECAYAPHCQWQMKLHMIVFIIAMNMREQRTCGPLQLHQANITARLMRSFNQIRYRLLIVVTLHLVWVRQRAVLTGPTIITRRLPL